MMHILFVMAICICLFVAIFFILAALCAAPSGKQTLAAYRVRHPKSKKKSLWTKIQTTMAVWIENLPIKKYTAKIEPILRYDKAQRSAEMYLANMSIKMLSLVCIGLVAGVIFPAFFIVCIAGPILVYWDEYKQLQSISQKRKENIEKDLPSFLAAVLVGLSGDRDVVGMIRNYIPYASPELKAELQTTLLDMESGSYERALLRLEQRVCSSHMSAVVRGLIGVTRGNDERTYFQLLAHTIRQAELTRQKEKALKVKPRFMFAAGMVLVSSLLVIFGVMLIDLAGKSSQLFG